MMKSGIAAALTVALVGCGSATDGDAEAQDDTPSSQTPTSPGKTPKTSEIKPASGASLSAHGLSLNLPKGWADITEDAPEGILLSGVDVGADENPAMLIVSRLPKGPSGAGAAETSGAALLEDDGARRVRPLDRLEVAGVAATHLRGVRAGGGVHVMLDQFTLLSGSEAWVLTFSTNQWQVDKDRQRMIDSVLATVSLGS